MPIWDTVVRSDVGPAQLARATKLFVNGEGPFYTRHRYPYATKTFTDPRLVASMLGKEKPMSNYITQPQLADVSPAAIGGMAIGTGLVAGVINGAIGGLLVYGVARLISTPPAKSKTAAYWGAGIIGVSTAVMFGLVGGAAASAASDQQQQVVEPPSTSIDSGFPSGFVS